MIDAFVYEATHGNSTASLDQQRAASMRQRPLPRRDPPHLQPQRRPPDLFDVTCEVRRGGRRIFAPHFPPFRRRRAGALNAADPPLTTDPVALLAERYHQRPRPFLALLRREKATLGCYCHAPADASGCHRVVLAWVLLQIAHSVGISVRYEGEWGRVRAPR